ncbi:hypothetical protein Leryth_015288 [Lithospermum erythrorhizon]|nr:hypothetical protein Leryth_015288 [Lithospermum erythrorhizon]
MLLCWAIKKTASSTRYGRYSKPKNMGVKNFDGESRTWKYYCSAKGHTVPPRR